MHLWIPSFVLKGIVFSHQSLICSPFAATNFFGVVFRSSLTRGNIVHHVARSSRIDGDSDFDPLVFYLLNLLRIRTVTDCSPCSTVTLDCPSSPSLVLLADHVLPLFVLAFFQQAPCLQILFVHGRFFSVLTVVFVKALKCLFPPFLHQVQCVLSHRTSNTFWESPLPPFSCPFPPFFPLPFCHEFFPPSFPPVPPFSFQFSPLPNPHFPLPVPL